MEPPCLELGFDYSSCYHLGFVNFSFYQPRMDMKYNIFYEIRGVVIFFITWQAEIDQKRAGVRVMREILRAYRSPDLAEREVELADRVRGRVVFSRRR